MKENQPQDYSDQDRGDHDAYNRYLQGMDASMRQKVALTAAHLLCEGRVADMGMGSGTGSHALASLYPYLEVIGVDINPQMVERAQDRYPLPNLGFLEGDIAQRCFPDASLQAVLNSSVLHHVTTFSGYDHRAASTALAAQVEQLQRGGVVIVRDFLDPGKGKVWLDLPWNDKNTDDLGLCSAATLFERFATEFRILLPKAQQGFEYRRLEGTNHCPLPHGWRRYELSRKHAVEFVLRKDYRRDWGIEVQEEYTYFTQRGFEEVLSSLGLRVLASTPIYNPWIVKNRFEGHFRWHDDQGHPLDWPATNYLVVGERVGPNQGVGFHHTDHGVIDYLTMSFWRRKTDDRVFDLASRPGLTLDVVPWYRQNGLVYVLGRRSYPRPILGVCGSALNGSQPTTWITEPLNVQQRGRPIQEVVAGLMNRFAEIELNSARSIHIGEAHYPSPGGLMEAVRSVHVEIDPVLVDAPLDSPSGFSTSGVLRAMEAAQLLRAAQVGGLPDARLEISVYQLLGRLELGFGEWIGASVVVSDGPIVKTTTVEQIFNRVKRQCFVSASKSESTGFIAVEAAEFKEVDKEGNTLSSQVLEWAMPRTTSHVSVACAPLMIRNGSVWLGLDIDDLPTEQNFTGHSDLPVAPAWRLFSQASGADRMMRAEAFIKERFRDEYGVVVGAITPLGGRYHPAPGLTPEVVHPFAVDVVDIVKGEHLRDLIWVELSSAIKKHQWFRDGHLSIVMMRAAHAVGLLPS